MQEVWKDIVGYEGRYKVSDQGRVWGRYRNKIMKPSVYSSGYLYLNLYNCQKKFKKRKIHHLVLESFVGQRPEGTECCHNDGNPTNNNLKNLRWDTSKSNINDKKKHGTFIYGEDLPWTRITENQVLEIHALAKAKVTTGEIAAKFNVSPSLIYCIVKRKIWKHLQLDVIDYYWHPQFRNEASYFRALEFVRRVQNGEKISQVAKSYKISTKNAYRDYRKFQKNIEIVKDRINV